SVWRWLPLFASGTSGHRARTAASCADAPAPLRVPETVEPPSPEPPSPLSSSFPAPHADRPSANTSDAVPSNDVRAREVLFTMVPLWDQGSRYCSDVTDARDFR